MSNPEGQPVGQPGISPSVQLERYKQMVESAGEVIFTTSVYGLFDYVNPAVKSILGYQPDEIIGRHFNDFIMPEWREAASQFYDDQLMNGVARTTAEFPLRRQSGEERWIEVTVNLLSSDGVYTGFLGFLRDVHDRRVIEEALKEANDALEARVAKRTADLQNQIRERTRIEQVLQSERSLLQNVIDHIPDYVYVKDTQSRFVVANRAVARLMGANSVEDLLGKTDFDFFPSEIAAHFFNDEQRLFTTGEPILDQDEAAAQYGTGEIVWMLTSKVPLRDERGVITGLVGIGRDITQRKHMEDELREQQALLRQVIDNDPNFIFVKDCEGRYQLANKSFAEMFALKPDDLLGNTDADIIFDPALVARFAEEDQHVLNALTPLFIPELPTKSHSSDDVRWLQVNKLPFPQRDGTYHLLGIASDITERKNAEQQAVALAVERERVRLLANFIRDASHDFRTPLSTINTSLYLLGKTSDPERQRQYRNVIEQQTAHLSNLLEAMLKMARLDSEHFFNIGTIDVTQMLQSIVMRDSKLAESVGVTLRQTVAPELLCVRGDAAEIERAVSELVKNAIQFTPPNRAVDITARREGGDVIISVEDTGIGIAPDDQPRVFERFFRADKARSSEKGGVGLGLSIAQKIIDAHDGHITFDSELGRGSTFRITLPAVDL